MNPLADVIDTLGFSSVWTYLTLFLAASLLMIWRLEALLDHGLEGTALGTIVMALPLRDQRSAVSAIGM